MRGEFPAIWRRPQENDQVVEIVGLRHKLVRQRIQVYNRLHGLALDAGLPRGKAKTLKFQKLVRQAEMNEAARLARMQYFALLSTIDERISELEE